MTKTSVSSQQITTDWNVSVWQHEQHGEVGVHRLSLVQSYTEEVTPLQCLVMWFCY